MAQLAAGMEITANSAGDVSANSITCPLELVMSLFIDALKAYLIVKWGHFSGRQLMK